ncbi:uncharacterized protein LOC126750643 [Anthonomus grandis grandis]|uniref:uncharacterized protein LOC126750643 n=1 Tax=Anthonomus grandis grandis TaxID=2921223 RepID=UPI0021668793|nr:uncharacterized protein LOC126750643 [Anthonomus grandis grandis]
MNFAIVLLCLGLLYPLVVFGSPKKYQAEDGGFSPSHRYYESDLPYKNKSGYIPKNPIAEPKKDFSDPKESRFGLVSYGSTGGGSYGSSGTGVSYGTMKLDIGGVALGVLLGLSIILIVPKISQVLGAVHGGYGRNLDDDMSAITNLLARIDNSLAANDIDSTSCTQRIICSVVNDAARNEKSGEATAMDQFILSFAKNSLFTYVLDGTAVKEALDIGKSNDAESCVARYSKCPLTREKVLKIMANLVPTNTK